MLRQYRTINCLLGLRVLLMLILVLSGCGGPTPAPTPTPEAIVVAATQTPTPEAINISATPVVTILKNPDITEVPVGGQVAISAEATGVNLQIQWSVKRGELSDTEGTSTIYTAPDTPGLDTVDVIVTSDSGSTTKTVTFTVVETPPEPSVTITITEPQSEVECPEGVACTFMITGTSTGIAPGSAYKIVPFVNPSPGVPHMWWPQPDRPLVSETWHAGAQIGTDEGEEPGHHFEIVALIMDAGTEIRVEFQPLPSSIAQSNIVSLVTTEQECPLDPSLRIPIEGPVVDVEVEITSPSHCDTGLATSMAAGGTYSGDLTGKEIWILVYPTDGKYYPQTLDACKQIPSDASGGNWQTTINFGGSPQQYDVVAVVTDANGEASREFKRWLKTGCETGDFPGYLRSELPGGITEVDAITVKKAGLTEEPTELPVTDTPVLPADQLKITGIICRPNADPVDLRGNKIFLPTRHFDRFGYDQSGFWVTVVNPQTGYQIDAQIIAFRDSHDSDMRMWDECDYALKETMRLALGGDLDEVAHIEPRGDRPPRTLVFSSTETSTACQSFRPRLKGAADFTGEVEIKTPNNCTTGLPTETNFPVCGTYEGVSDDVDIWVLVYPPNLIYYVQSPNACEGAKMSWGDGKWQVSVYLGAKGGDPEWFDIVVILADQEASQFLSDWLQQGCQTGQWSGIPAAQLEQMNITEKNYITVQTLD